MTHHPTGSSFAGFRDFLATLEGFNKYVFGDGRFSLCDPDTEWKYSHVMRTTRVASDLLRAVLPHLRGTRTEEVLIGAALLHDIGRFCPEGAGMERGGDISYEHGTLGAKILETEFFPSCSRYNFLEEQEIIFAVSVHDKQDVSPFLADFPAGLDTTKLWTLSELIRDADRTDNFRTFFSPYWWDRIRSGTPTPFDVAYNSVSDDLWGRFRVFKDCPENSRKTSGRRAFTGALSECFDAGKAKTLGDALVSSLASPLASVFAVSADACRNDPNFGNIIRQINKEDSRTTEILGTVLELYSMQ